MKNHQIVQYIKAPLPVPLMWASCKVYHIQHRVLIVFPFPTHTHEKLNSFRWEIILNATTWLATTVGLQSRWSFLYVAHLKKLYVCKFTKPKPNFTVPKECSSSQVQVAGLFIGACEVALSVQRIHCIRLIDFRNLFSHFLLVENNYWLLLVTCGKTWNCAERWGGLPMKALRLPSWASGSHFKISLFFHHLATKAESAPVLWKYLWSFRKKSLVNF
jgi:hypothetical protein